MSDQDPHHRWDTSIGRAAVYELLMRAFAYPTDEHRAALREWVGPVVRRLETGDAALQGALHAFFDTFDVPLDELRAAHLQMFTHIEPTDCPPYESAYVPADVFRQTEVMADVAGFYCAQGLHVGGADRERPDHIVTELEFLSFMARKEAHALDHLDAEHADRCQKVSDLFLRDHLGCWGPDFGRRVALVAAHPRLRTAGALLTTWLDADMARAGITPLLRLEHPAPPRPPDDDECGTACGLACTPDLKPTRARVETTS